MGDESIVIAASGAIVGTVEGEYSHRQKTECVRDYGSIQRGVFYFAGF
jgi:hypothetical protein